MTDITYELPNISVDVVPLYIDDNNGLGVLLSERIYEPFLGKYALPGVLLTPHERLDDAAYRALKTKSGVTADEVSLLLDAGAFDNPDRDPRGATVSLTKIALLKRAPYIVEEENPRTHMRTNWLASASDIIKGEISLPFDHTNIVTHAVNLFGEKFLASKQFTQAVLGKEFNTSLVRSLLTQLSEMTSSDHNYDASNLTRQLKSKGWFTPEMRSNEVSATARGVAPAAASVSPQSSLASTGRLLDSSTTSMSSRQGRPSQRWTWTD